MVRRHKAKNTPSRVIPYALEQLFIDQDHDWVVDTIAPVIAWVPQQTTKQPFRFSVVHTTNGIASDVELQLSWDPVALERLVPGVIAHSQRFATGRTAEREHLTQLAAYGLTFVAISVLMPGRRVVHMQMGVAPDILLDVSPGALRGVEASGRASGGASALRIVRNGTKKTPKRPATPGKRSQLIARVDIAEVYLSLWCASPRVGMMEQLK